MQHVVRSQGLACATLIRLRDYWIELRAGKNMPSRQDLNPSQIRDLLPFVVLTDVLADARQLRYRLIGTFVTTLAGRNATGRWLDADLYGDRLDDFLWAYRTCLSRLEPVAVREYVQFSDRDWVIIEALLMPLGEHAGGANMILSGVDVAPPGTDLPPRGTSFVLDWRAPTLEHSR
jgi:hypothetical protein